MKQPIELIPIERVLVFGDSLSDRGKMKDSLLSAFSGLKNSPYGRFSDEYVWLDYFIEKLMSMILLIQAKPIAQQKKEWFSVNTEEYVGLPELPAFVRTYCIGGMTAHDYSKTIRPGKPILNAEAQALSSLDHMREEALRDDRTINLSLDEKKSTLVIEWSGANDLITINTEPTEEAAKLAIAARIRNIEVLIKEGYTNFLLFNQPSLDLTPRFQEASEELREKARKSVNYFNQELINQIDILEERYSCSFYIFDAHTLFEDAFHHPENYGFDPDKKQIPFLESKEFKSGDPRIAAKLHIFWDKVHPTAAVQRLLAQKLWDDMFNQYFKFIFSPQPLVERFRQAYGMRLDADRSKTCGCTARSEIDYQNLDLSVSDILAHGLSNEYSIFGKRGARTLHTIQRDLRWIDGKKQLIDNHPSLVEAWKKLNIHAQTVVSQDTAASTDLVENNTVELTAI